VELSQDLDLEADGAARIAEVEALLDRRSSIDPQLLTIVEMRVFEGFSIPEIAARRNCGARTVDRRSAFARKWLEHQLVPARPDPFRQLKNFGGFWRELPPCSPIPL